jgi:hypothetical protein
VIFEFRTNVGERRSSVAASSGKIHQNQFLYLVQVLLQLFAHQAGISTIGDNPEIILHSGFLLLLLSCFDILLVVLQ